MKGNEDMTTAYEAAAVAREPELSGQTVVAVEVGGSSRGVRIDAARGVFSYVLAASASGRS